MRARRTLSGARGFTGTSFDVSMPDENSARAMAAPQPAEGRTTKGDNR